MKRGKINEIIKKKRDCNELSKEEIHFFIREYSTGNIPDFQASSLLMAIYLNGMSQREITDLTIAMAYSGNSRPASGSEHHMSHFFEVLGILKNEPYFMHGTDVLYSAYYTEKMREELIALPEVKANSEFSKEEWKKKILSIYDAASEGVIALQEKMGWYEEPKLPVYREKWDEIKACLKEVPTSKELLGLIESIGLDIKEFDALYGEEKIKNAMLYAKDLKDRYSVLWLYYELMA